MILERARAEGLLALAEHDVDEERVLAGSLERAGQRRHEAARLAGAQRDLRLRERLDEIQLQAALTLATSYLEQAQYEEREGRFDEAARSYERVARAKASPKVFERTAYCILSARGDLKAAAEWGKKAVQSAPEDAGFRVTLARIYLEAGLHQSAAAEFERAATLSPSDDTIKDWLRKARRADG